jgi:hypothetical protein
MQPSPPLRVIAHELRNLLQRVANRAEAITLASSDAERAEHAARLLHHIEEVAGVVARLDELDDGGPSHAPVRRRISAR